MNARTAERRAFPPISSHLTVNEHHRSFVPYLFTQPGDDAGGAAGGASVLTETVGE